MNNFMRRQQNDWSDISDALIDSDDKSNDSTETACVFQIGDLVAKGKTLKNRSQRRTSHYRNTNESLDEKSVAQNAHNSNYKFTVPQLPTFRNGTLPKVRDCTNPSDSEVSVVICRKPQVMYRTLDTRHSSTPLKDTCQGINIVARGKTNQGMDETPIDMVGRRSNSNYSCENEKEIAHRPSFDLTESLRKEVYRRQMAGPTINKIPLEKVSYNDISKLVNAVNNNTISPHKKQILIEALETSSKNSFNGNNMSRRTVQDKKIQQSSTSKSGYSPSSSDISSSDDCTHSSRSRRTLLKQRNTSKSLQLNNVYYNSPPRQFEVNNLDTLSSVGSFPVKNGLIRSIEYIDPCRHTMQPVQTKEYNSGKNGLPFNTSKFRRHQEAQPEDHARGYSMISEYSNLSMQPSLIRRKLFSQSKLLSESSGVNNSDSPMRRVAVQNVYKARDDKERRKRKRSMLYRSSMTQSYMSHGGHDSALSVKPGSITPLLRKLASRGQTSNPVLINDRAKRDLPRDNTRENVLAHFYSSRKSRNCSGKSRTLFSSGPDSETEDKNLCEEEHMNTNNINPKTDQVEKNLELKKCYVALERLPIQVLKSVISQSKNKQKMGNCSNNLDSYKEDFEIPKKSPSNEGQKKDVAHSEGVNNSVNHTLNTNPSQETSVALQKRKYVRRKDKPIIPTDVRRSSRIRLPPLNYWLTESALFHQGRLYPWQENYFNSSQSIDPSCNKKSKNKKQKRKMFCEEDSLENNVSKVLEIIDPKTLKIDKHRGKSIPNKKKSIADSENNTSVEIMQQKENFIEPTSLSETNVLSNISNNMPNNNKNLNKEIDESNNLDIISQNIFVNNREEVSTSAKRVRSIKTNDNMSKNVFNPIGTQQNIFKSPNELNNTVKSVVRYDENPNKKKLTNSNILNGISQNARVNDEKEVFTSAKRVRSIKNNDNISKNVTNQKQKNIIESPDKRNDTVNSVVRYIENSNKEKITNSNILDVISENVRVNDKKNVLTSAKRVRSIKNDDNISKNVTNQKQKNILEFPNKRNDTVNSVVRYIENSNEEKITNSNILDVISENVRVNDKKDVLTSAKRVRSIKNNDNMSKIMTNQKQQNIFKSPNELNNTVKSVVWFNENSNKEKVTNSNILDVISENARVNDKKDVLTSAKQVRSIKTKINMSKNLTNQKQQNIFKSPNELNNTVNSVVRYNENSNKEEITNSNILDGISQNTRVNDKKDVFTSAKRGRSKKTDDDMSKNVTNQKQKNILESPNKRNNTVNSVVWYIGNSNKEKNTNSNILDGISQNSRVNDKKDVFTSAKRGRSRKTDDDMSKNVTNPIQTQQNIFKSPNKLHNTSNSVVLNSDDEECWSVSFSSTKSRKHTKFLHFF